MNIGTLTAHLRADTKQFTAGMAKASAAMRKTADGSRLTTKQVASLKDGLLKAAKAAGVAALAISALSVIEFKNLEFGIRRVAAVSGATSDEMRQLTATAREMGRTTVFTATESAEAMQFLAMAGNDASTSIKALPSVLQLATAGAVGLGEAADVVTNIMAGFGQSATDLARTNDILVATFTGSNTTLSELGEAFKVAGPVAKTLGVSMEDTAAAIGILGNAGIKASDAGTGLKRAMTAMLSTSKKTQKAMGELGLSTSDVTQGFSHIVSILGRARDAMGAEEFTGKLFETFGERAGPKMAALVEQGAVAIEKLKDRIAGSDGLAERIEKAQLDTLSGQFDLVKSAALGLAEALGQKLADSTRSAAEGLADLMNKVTDAVVHLTDFETMVKNSQERSERWRAINTALGDGLADLGAEINRLRIKEMTGNTEEVFEAQLALSQVVPEVMRGFGKLRQEISQARRDGLQPAAEDVKTVVDRIDKLVKQLRAGASAADGVAPALDGVKTAVAEGAAAVAGGAAEWVNYSESVAATTRELKMLLGEVRQISAGEFEDMLRAASGVERITRQEFMGYSYASPFRLGGAKGLARLPEKERFQWAEGLKGGEGGALGLMDILKGGPSMIGGLIGKGIGSTLGGPTGAMIGSAIGSAFVSVVTGGLSTMLGGVVDAIKGGVDAIVGPSVGRAIPTEAIQGAGSAAVGGAALVGGGGAAAAFATGNLFTAIPGMMAAVVGGGLAGAAAGATAGLLALGSSSEKAKRFYEVLDQASSHLSEAAGQIFESMMPLAFAMSSMAKAFAPIITQFADISGVMPLVIGGMKALGITIAWLGEASSFLARAFTKATAYIADFFGQEDIAKRMRDYSDTLTATILQFRRAREDIEQIGALNEARAAEILQIETLTDTMRELNEEFRNLPPGYNIRRAVQNADVGAANPAVSLLSAPAAPGSLPWI